MDPAKMEEHMKTFRYEEYKPTNMLLGVMKAIETKDYTDIKKQLAGGRDPNVKNMSETLPLELAAWRGDQEFINILIDAGADPKPCRIEDYYDITEIKKI